MNAARKSYRDGKRRKAKRHHNTILSADPWRGKRGVGIIEAASPTPPPSVPFFATNMEDAVFGAKDGIRGKDKPIALVNMGDCPEILTAGELQSPKHQIVR